MRLGIAAEVTIVSSLGLTACFDPSSVGDTESSTTEASTVSATGPDESTSSVDGSTTDGPGTSDADGSSTDDGPPLDPCDPNPCVNGGTCVSAGNDATCDCPADFSGDTCETPVEPCNPNPCVNGACLVGDDGQYCDCAPEWTGELCDEDLDECAANPCLNGGTCVNEEGGFSCQCAPGFDGDLCDTDIDDCAPNPCLNGGTCTDGVDSYSCACPGAFSGDMCECGPGGPIEVDYTSMGTFVSASLYDDPPGVTVTGSNSINVLNLNGLGIVGGVNNNTVDGNELIEFTFDTPVAAVSYFVSSAGNQNGDGFVGSAFLQGWDENNLSLGAVPVNGTGVFSLDALLGASLISRFRVTANIDNLRISTMTASPIVCQ